MSKRVFLIVLDSAGCGAAPDAAAFGDAGCDTFGSCVRSGGLQVPVMQSLGLYNIQGTSFYQPVPRVKGAYLKLAERSCGKDTTVGHWEIAGTVTDRPFPTYPEGFPEEIIRQFEEATGRKALCNRPYSGTQCIHDYGRQQIAEGAYIVYTSADSVFQIAAHEDYIPLETLYGDCRKARAILQGEHGVARVIARPYVGEWPDYERTVNRHDFSLQPPRRTLLDALAEAGQETIGVGKIYDIFAGKSISETYANEGNTLNMERTLQLAERDFAGLCFVNLVDTDALYGHRRDIPGYTAALNAADAQIGQLMEMLRPEDLLIVTADHGCDPGFTGTDHTREYIPCLICGDMVAEDRDLGIRDTYADIAATVAEYLGVDYSGDGASFLQALLR